MKKRLLSFFAFGLVLCACEPEHDSIIGIWTVDKVSVQFDENRSTPALVKQVGEMERGNTLSIGEDSTLLFKGTDEQWTGRISLVNDSVLRCKGRDWGIWKDGRIVTTTTSPLGEVVISYKKN